MNWKDLTFIFSPYHKPEQVIELTGRLFSDETAQLSDGDLQVIGKKLHERVDKGCKELSLPALLLKQTRAIFSKIDELLGVTSEPIDFEQIEHEDARDQDDEKANEMLMAELDKL